MKLSMRRGLAGLAAVPLAFAAVLIGGTPAQAATTVTLDSNSYNVGDVISGTMVPDAGFCSGAVGEVKYMFSVISSDGTTTKRNFLTGMIHGSTAWNAWNFTPGQTLQFDLKTSNPLSPYDDGKVINDGDVQITEVYCFDLGNNTEQLGSPQAVSGTTFAYNAYSADSTVVSGSDWTLTPAGGNAGLNKICGDDDFYTPEMSIGVEYKDADGNVVAAQPAGWTHENSNGDPSGAGFQTVDAQTTELSVPTTGLAAGDYTAELWCVTNDGGYWSNFGYKTAITVTPAADTTEKEALAATGSDLRMELLAGFGLLLVGAAMALFQHKRKNS